MNRNGPPDVQMNWLSRFLHIKPATRTLCFHVGRGKVRGDLVRLLRDWQRFGVRDVTFDRKANTINARVDKVNRKSPPDFDVLHPLAFTSYSHPVPNTSNTVIQISRLSQSLSSSSFSSFWSMAIVRICAWPDSSKSEVQHRVSVRLSTSSKMCAVQS